MSLKELFHSNIGRCEDVQANRSKGLREILKKSKKKEHISELRGSASALYPPLCEKGVDSDEISRVF
jgi:hypothetical protein